MLRNIVAITRLFLACALGSGAAIGFADPPAGPVAAQADFPYDLQGLAGRDDGVMASLREKKTGKSSWVSRGEKAGGYTLESADAVKGVAVFSKGGVNIRAALATPAPPEEKPKTDPVRNAATEKGMFNDARRIASAANQYWAERNSRSVTVAQLRVYFTDNKPAEGLKIAVVDTEGGKPVAPVEFNSKAADNLVLTSGSKFVLFRDDYDKGLSTNPNLLPAGTSAKNTRGGVQGIEFATDTAIVNP